LKPLDLIRSGGLRINTSDTISSDALTFGLGLDLSQELLSSRVQRLYHSLDRACFCLNKLFDQAKESMWGMPRYTEARKAAVSCDKPGGAAHEH
jgi:hypothetical protein